MDQNETEKNWEKAVTGNSRELHINADEFSD